MDGGCSRRTDDKMDTQSFGIPLLTPRNGVVEVEGEEITSDEFHSAGGCWMPVLLKARAEKKALSLTAGSQPNRTLGRDGRARIKKTPRPPKLPEDDAKIVFRLRGGLNVRKEDRVLVQRSIQRAAQLSSENAGHDAFRFNEEQNTVTKKILGKAVKYGGVHSISLKGQTYEVVAYAIPPDDTIKGVIHGIPDEDSEQDVLNNLVTARNPNVLHTRRMGRSKSAVVLFKGKKVPFWIMYGNVEYTICGTCGGVGHRIDVCPRPKEQRCMICNTLNPTDGHACSPSCGTCGKAHSTGDTRCKQRFKTPYILQQRQWEKKKKQEESRFKEVDFPPLPKGRSRSRSRSRSRASVRSTSRQRSGSRWRSRSRRRSSSRQRICWDGVTDHKSSEKKSKEAKTQNDKLDEILVMMRQLQEENNALRVMVEKTERENVWLRTQLQQKSNEAEKEPEKASPPAKRKMVVRPGQETVALDKAEAPLQQEVNKQVVELMCNPEWLTQLARHMEQLLEHVLIEIISGKKKDQGSLFVLSIYSSPAKRHRFASLFQATLKIARRQTLVVVGDFNAQHPDWGYKIKRLKGRKLWIDSHECGLSLITDPDHPTRRGDARQQDTTPDLTFVRYAKDAEWTNTWEDLGSDHYVLKTTIRAGPGKPRGRKCKITEWNKFRELLGEYETEDRTTKVIPEEADVAASDGRLLHLWEAKASLQERQRTQRNNRSLRRRIAQLSRTIETYAGQVTRQQWQDTCDGFDGQPNVPKTWNILRHLLDPDGCKTAQRSKMCEIIRSHKGDEDDLVEEIRKRYIGDNPPRTPTTYGGADNEVLDADISVFEVTETLRDLKTKSAPGPDGVTNKMLRNLSNEAITGITKYINECWRQGQLPRQWKTAKVVMIPKPGKKPQLDALRPISLTSCVGKIMELVVLRRINDFMERNQLFPHTMVGFRPHLSTQDVMLRLKHQIIDGEKNFLSDRTTQISIGGVTSDDINLGGRGTPQGSVLSPYLFNVAMIELPAKLSKIEGLHHSIYADDITLWMTGGRDGFIQDTLQEAIRTIEEYVTPRGLTCSPQKSELLLLKPVRSRQLPSDIALYSQGLRIPSVKSIRILGRRVQADGNNYEMIESLKASTYQIPRLISRISGRHFGRKEKNLVRLVRAFVVSRLAYVLPFLRLGVAEKAKLDCLIRKAYKRALGIPDSTSNEKLAALGLHNTVEEIVEAQRTSQLERLTKSATGRHILEKLGIRYERQTGEKIDVPRRVREKLTIPNLPRKIVASCSVRTTEPEVAEEVAIALALKLQDAKIVVSDSQMAIRQYAKGRISPVTLRVLGDPEKTAKVKLIWTPAHSSLPGNEEAHDAARGLTRRAGATLVTFRDTLDYYDGERMRYPPAHPSLDKRQEVAPVQLSRWYPDRYKGDCQLCGARATLHHIVWECSRLDRTAQPLLKKIPNQESWEALLLCTDLKVQEQVVRLAEDVAGVQGIMAVA
ncbi:hypothetical protein HPB47_025010 [Ixodes persulcatus]|uniref:Uncharacterized protein n=1 Tax=Ixodes persulcatus TaxID=34615 RepID=A0AC60Q375_IXOPE|nr:hypothetical protein HPB47_025010 [Ixodes persulcatus]